MMKAILTWCAACTVLIAPAVQAQGWRYESETDKMTSQKISDASILSEKSLALRFPYQGTNYSQLTVRQKGKRRAEVIFMVEKGQLMCHPGDCSIRLRFDEAPPVTFSGVRPSDHSSNAMFLDDPSRFIASARKAKKILVEASFYQQGAQVIDFVSPAVLDWPPK